MSVVQKVWYSNRSMRSGIKTIVFYVCIFILFLGVIYYAFPVPCKQGVMYSIGTLDKRFKLSREEFRTVIQEAEDAWEQASGKNLFTYDENAAFTINLIYDDRQGRTDKAKIATNILDTNVKTRQQVQQQYNAAYAVYTKAQNTYRANLAEYEQQVGTLNTDIQEVNAAGGASSQEYAKLQQRQKGIDARRDKLEKERLALNDLAAQVNILADNESKIVETYNAEVTKLNEEFGDEREFQQGEYSMDAITIYEFSKLEDLRLVLEHEFGHALGIGHVESPASLMYYVANEMNRNTGPTKDDIAALNVQCEKTSFTLFLERLRGAYMTLVLQ